MNILILCNTTFIISVVLLIYITLKITIGGTINPFELKKFAVIVSVLTVLSLISLYFILFFGLTDVIQIINSVQ